jgi:hypothetical protein
MNSEVANLRNRVAELFAENASLKRIAVVASNRRVDLMQALRTIVEAAEATAEDVKACGCERCVGLREAVKAGREVLE